MAQSQSGKNVALLVGINYSVTRLKNWPKLGGCHNDVDAVRATLIGVYGFDPNDIEVLMDKPGTQARAMPTGANIKSALKRLISQLREGDVLFFHFSGHGTHVPRHGRSVEAIVPCDNNVITNMDFRQLVNRVPRGATFMFFSDSCHSGGLIDKEKEQIGPSTSFRNRTTQPYNRRYVPGETVVAALRETVPLLRGPNNTPPDIDNIMMHKFGDNASLLFRYTRTRSPQPQPLKSAQGILLSACQSDEYAGECVNKKKIFGAFTSAVQVIIKEKLMSEPFSIKKLVMKVREIMPTRILKLENSGDCQQHPCLYCSDDSVNLTFLSNAEKTLSCSEQGWYSAPSMQKGPPQQEWYGLSRMQ